MKGFLKSSKEATNEMLREVTWWLQYEPTIALSGILMFSIVMVFVVVETLTSMTGRI